MHSSYSIKISIVQFLKLTEHDSLIGYAKRTQICTHAHTHIHLLNSIALNLQNVQRLSLVKEWWNHTQLECMNVKIFLRKPIAILCIISLLQMWLGL